MAGSASSVAASPARRLARGLRIGAAALAAHGLLLASLGAARDFLPTVSEAVGVAVFWVLALPALVLTQPFTGLLWRLGLMSAPGWFAWPKPLGFALAYAAWIAALLGPAWAIGARSGTTEPGGRQR